MMNTGMKRNQPMEKKNEKVWFLTIFRAVVGKIANTIVAPVTQFIVDSDYVQLKIEASELLEQLLVLSFSSQQVALYDSLIHEESPLDKFLNEEDEEDDPCMLPSPLSLIILLPVLYLFVLSPLSPFFRLSFLLLTLKLN